MKPNKLIIKMMMVATVLCAVSYSQTEVLTNANIIDMTKAGLSSEIILVKIKTSVASFDISTSALIQMKQAGVADDVITAVVDIGRSGPGRGAAVAATGNAGNPAPSNDPARTSLMT